MNWKEKLATVRDTVQDVPEDRARQYDIEKDKGIPIIAKEEDTPFEQVHPQPVYSPGIYEAEFFTKGRDMIFHFWPHGYHEADDLNKVLPRFPKIFGQVLKDVMGKVLAPTDIEIHDDRDVGAWFVRAKGLADRPFARNLAIEACEGVHKGMGGKD